MSRKHVAFLLTWNPSLRPMNVAGEAEVLRRGGTIPGRWSVCPRTGGILPGDELWLFRTGRADSDPGIVRRGRAADEVFQAAHWSREKAAAGITTNYVLLEWIEHVPDDRTLSRAVLIRHVPGPPWATLQASGIGLQGQVAERLREVWDKHVAGATGSHGGSPSTPLVPALSSATVAVDDSTRPAAHRFVLRYLRDHSVAYTADLLRESKEYRVFGDVMLVLFKLHRDGEIVREAGPPVRWSLAVIPVDAASESSEPSAKICEAPSASEGAMRVAAREVVELYLNWSNAQWSDAQTRAALQSPNIERMTAFSRAELVQSLRELDVNQSIGHWDDWFQAAKRRRSGTIRL
jgi:hypothetical protein